MNQDIPQVPPTPYPSGRDITIPNGKPRCVSTPAFLQNIDSKQRLEITIRNNDAKQRLEKRIELRKPGKMKKIIFAIFGCVALMMAGCTDNNQELNRKIETMDGQTVFSQKEFGQMLDYLNENVDAVMASDDMTEKMEKYPYFPNFMSMVRVADMRGELDSANREKFDALMQKYESSDAGHSEPDYEE